MAALYTNPSVRSSVGLGPRRPVSYHAAMVVSDSTAARSPAAAARAALAHYLSQTDAGDLADCLAAELDQRAFAAWLGAAQSGELGHLGRRLRALGLTPQAVEYVIGVRNPVHAPWRARARSAATWPMLDGAPPAALMVHLWVTGALLPEAPVRARLGDDFERLCELGLLACAADRVAATVTALPIGEALIVSDRAFARRGRDTVLLADDSALHTIGVVPAHAPGPDFRWLDVGTGSAAIPLARPGAAARILGTDIHPRAVAMARLGVALGGIGHIDIEVADLLQGAPGGWHRVTFNAPIPEGWHDDDDQLQGASLPWYRYGSGDILARFWSQIPALVAPGGEVLVHSIVSADEYDTTVPLPDVSGQLVVARYTPEGIAPAFGITVWRPDHPTERRHVSLTPSARAPHVTRAALGLAD